MKDGDGWSLLDIPRQLNTDTSKSYFIVKSYILQDILRPGGEGLVQLKVWREGGESGYFNETVKVNEPPVAGNCTCHPKIGEGYKTDFQAMCIDWEDPDKPLSYGFSYGDGGDVTPVPKSSENPSSTSKFKIYKLPDEGMSSIKIPITISVEDALGWKIEMIIYTEAREINLKSWESTFGLCP